MKRIINEKDLIEKFSGEGKVTLLDKSEHLKASEQLAQQMEKVRRDYHQKDAKSQDALAHVRFS